MRPRKELQDSFRSVKFFKALVGNKQAARQEELAVFFCPNGEVSQFSLAPPQGTVDAFAKIATLGPKFLCDDTTTRSLALL